METVLRRYSKRWTVLCPMCKCSSCFSSKKKLLEDFFPPLLILTNMCLLLHYNNTGIVIIHSLTVLVILSK